jgi:hypothetical protein
LGNIKRKIRENITRAERYDNTKEHGWGCSSVVKRLPSIPKILTSVPNTERGKKELKELEQ